MPTKINEDMLRIACSIPEVRRLSDLENRRLYLYGEISGIEDGEGDLSCASNTGGLIEHIFNINREDQEAGLSSNDRKPIVLYINSPGGDLNEGFALIDAIELSKTPVWTVNVGQWSSMSFLIGITGHRRFSLPHATFLLHDGASGAYGSTNKVQDRVKFEERYENEVIKPHVLFHSKMEAIDYDALARVEYYMLPQDAKRRGFIDEIVADIDTIL